MLSFLRCSTGKQELRADFNAFVFVSFSIVVLLSLTEGQLVIKHYELCGGKGTIKWIKVTPCVQEPCRFARNTKINVEMEADFEKPSKTVTMSSIAKVGDTNMTLVGTPTDFCKAKIVVCPVKGKGDFRTVKFIVPIKKFYTPNPYNATFQGYGDSGREICVRLLIYVLDEMI